MASIIGFISIGVTLVIAIVGVIFYFGRMDEKMKGMQKALDDLTERNDREHMAFSAVEKTTIEMNMEIKSINKTISRMEHNVEELLSRVRGRRRREDDGEEEDADF